jgi:hypothetical protein
MADLLSATAFMTAAASRIRVSPRLMRACLATAMLAGWSGPALADAPAFDRPGIAFSPSVLPAGGFALEQGLPDFQRDEWDGVGNRAWSAGTTFRAGLANTLELQIAGSVWNRSSVRAGGITTREEGAGDTRFSIKWAPALPVESLSLALLGSATADTGAAAFSNGRPVYSLGATLGSKVGTDCAVALYANVDHSDGIDTWTVSPNFSFPIVGDLGGYVEAGRTTGGGESDSRGGGGVTLLLHDRVQLDLYALHGLTRSSPDLTAAFSYNPRRYSAASRRACKEDSGIDPPSRRLNVAWGRESGMQARRLPRKRVDPFPRDAAMPVQNAAATVMAAVSVLQEARTACANLHPLSFPMTDRELHQRADMIDKVIRARRKLQLLRDRAEALEGALDRFKARRAAMRL